MFLGIQRKNNPDPEKELAFMNVLGADSCFDSAVKNWQEDEDNCGDFEQQGCLHGLLCLLWRR